MNALSPSTTKSFSGAIRMAAVAFAVTIVLAGASLLPEANPLHVSTFVVSLAGKYLAYAILALSVDLVWGFAGILTLGHAAFFALGGYVMGMYLMREIGTRGVYGNPNLPDFMIFLSWKSLPWYWWGSDHFAWAMLLVLIVPGILAGVFGWLAFRSRVSGVYLSIITQALTYALMLAFFQNGLGFGGNNGLTDFKDILGADLHSPLTRAVLLVVTGAVLAGGLLLSRWLVSGRFGYLLVAVRDAENRTRFLGYRPEQAKLLIWVFSAMVAGIGGALYVTQVGIINPGEFAPANSIESVIWVAVGGRGTLSGSVLGAVLVSCGKTLFTAWLPEFWLYGLGLLFLVTTLFLPQGLMGLRHHLVKKQPEEVTPEVSNPEGEEA
ncbi:MULTISPECIES: urea ABC transporter permease subunit UrtC [Acetobacter]|uniref:Urea ABC transporter permease subunit UrtC n=4 Tax=Acetobacter TaxID=434 RepID=A0AAN1PFW4_9PROT|nr:MULTISPECIES: urea ABC transporter permease subunit UrtC [Acetobacter]ASL41190.1 urea ABC transporter permease subunit UrtC [Acetobacter oryzifermentans]AXM99488.1 urea ABC transporter permease subunit UrtC [Acetobacter pomorum]KAA8394632.1 urea ABC transporter permease subunit UrtC [Acetobacter sp. DmW_125127]KAA8398149.1 urea ABC transporter permease subunit UrtC [Acetobacter sp. DmW_125124]KAA8400283.1 urea ABC transporter permease subunit UrtC [Acetobacter sp. DmW_125128]